MLLSLSEYGHFSSCILQVTYTAIILFLEVLFAVLKFLIEKFFI